MSNDAKRLPRKRFAKIHQMACDVGNAILAREPSFEIEKLNENLLVEIDLALHEYGASPDLLAIKGDFLNDPIKASEVLEQALSLAIENKDDLNVLLIGDSLIRNLRERKVPIERLDAVFHICADYAVKRGLVDDPDYLEMKRFYLNGD